MSALGLPIFDKAIQDANIWVNEVMDELDWDDKQRAYNLLRSTLHVLRDRLAPDEALNIIAEHISQGEMDDVRATLPKELRNLWD